MADIGATVQSEANARTIAGSITSDWQVLNSNVSTAVGSSAHLTQIEDASPDYIVMPAGCTRFLAALRVPTTGTTTVTTNPVIRFYGVDANGVPIRLDNADPSVAGVTMTIGATGSIKSIKYTQDSVEYHLGGVIDLSGYDALGCGRITALVETAAAYTDGTNPIAVSLMVKVLN